MKFPLFGVLVLQRYILLVYDIVVFLEVELAIVIVLGVLGFLIFLIGPKLLF